MRAIEGDTPGPRFLLSATPGHSKARVSGDLDAFSSGIIQEDVSHRRSSTVTLDRTARILGKPSSSHGSRTRRTAEHAEPDIVGRVSSRAPPCPTASQVADDHDPTQPSPIIDP